MSAITAPLGRIDELTFLSSEQKKQVVKLVKEEREYEFLESKMSHLYVRDPSWHSPYGACNHNGDPVCFLPKRKTYPMRSLPMIPFYGQTWNDVETQEEIHWVKKVIEDREGVAAVAKALEVASIDFLNQYHEKLFGF